MFNYSYKLLKLLELYADTVAILGYMLLLERPLQGIALQCSPGQALQPLPRIAYAAAVAAVSVPHRLQTDTPPS